MGVTEFALIKLRKGYDELDFLELLMQCQEIQDEWSRQHHPHVLSNKPYTFLSTFCIQKCDPPYLLITAPWDSPETHREWIQSNENQSAFAKLSECIDPGCDSVLLFHMNPAGKQEDVRTDLFAKEEFNVCRVSVSAGKRKAAQEKYQSIEHQVRAMRCGTRIWGGWRIEKDQDIEDLIVFWNQGVPGELMQGLLSMSEKESEIRHFQHVV
ncbi:Fc.00g047570.m01.CDS01 [Cosmosporella sp. VM-42]